MCICMYIYQIAYTYLKQSCSFCLRVRAYMCIQYAAYTYLTQHAAFCLWLWCHAATCHDQAHSGQICVYCMCRGSAQLGRGRPPGRIRMYLGLCSSSRAPGKHSCPPACPPSVCSIHGHLSLPHAQLACQSEFAPPGPSCTGVQVLAQWLLRVASDEPA